MIGPLGENLIFIVSQPRAGSTLLQRVLAGHPDIHTTAEPWIMLHPLFALKEEGMSSDYNCALARDATNDFIATLDRGPDSYLTAVRAYARTLYNAALPVGKTIFLDKTPRYYFVLPELQRVFPLAKIIFLRRNPLAVLASIIESWTGWDDIKLAGFHHDLYTAPVKIADFNGIAYNIRYEMLVKWPHGMVRSLCAAMEMEFFPAMVEYGEREKPKGRMGDRFGIDKHTRPVTDSLDKWKQTLASSWANKQAHVYLDKLGDEFLNRFGYPPALLRKELNGITPIPDPAGGGPSVAA